MTPLAIIHEDTECIALDKPTGLAVIPGHQLPIEETLVHLVTQHCNQKVFVVHRIDRETSGLILFAKTAAAHRLFCRQFEAREVTKEYRAVVQGLLTVSGEINAPIKQFGSGRMGIHPLGKECQTGYAVIQQFAAATELSVLPHTGRRHQIRVHLYSIQHPVLGDTRYGTNRPVGGIGRLMLHASAIKIKHPDGSTLSLCVPPGPDWDGQMQTIKSQ